MWYLPGMYVVLYLERVDLLFVLGFAGTHALKAHFQLRDKSLRKEKEKEGRKKTRKGIGGAGAGRRCVSYPTLPQYQGFLQDRRQLDMLFNMTSDTTGLRHGRVL